MHRSIFAALVATFVLSFATPLAVAAADEIGTTGASTYQVMPDKGLIRVSVTLKVTNRVPSTVSSYDCSYQYYDYWYGWMTIPKTCSSTTRYYVNETSLWVESGARQVRVTTNGGKAKLTPDKKTESFRSYKVTFPKIFNGQTRTLKATYVLRGGTPRSATTDRVNGAYLNFWAMSQPTDKATVRIEIPKAFEIETYGGSVSRSVKGNTRILANGNVAEPAKYFVGITGTNPSGFAKAQLTTGDGRAVSILGWPGDKAWMAAVRREAESALPKLAALIGQPIPGQGPITIREAAGSDLGDAYIGAFDPTSQVAQVSEDFGQAGTVTHELSHAWFNDELFDGRWLSEGYATWIERATGEVSTGCTVPNYPGDGSPAIGSWRVANPRATEQELRIVSYQYDAACWIVSSIAAQIGADRMREVIGVLATADGAYTGVPDARPGAPATWRDWLDAVDEIGMRPAGLDDTNAVASMLTQFGVATEADLTQRAVARQNLDALRDATGWSVPSAVTQPMARWSFQSAQAAMAIASETYALAGKVESLLPSIHVSTSPIRTSFEAASDVRELVATHDKAIAQVDAATVAADAVAQSEVQRGPIEQLGLVGTDLKTLAASAVSAVVSMDFAAAKAQSQQVSLAAAAASGSGLVRLGLGLGLIAAAALVIWAIRRRRRRRLPPVEDLAQQPIATTASTTASDTGSSEGALENEVRGFPPESVGAELRAIDPD
jgi:hypothetical protein